MVETFAPADALGLVGATIDQVRFDACVDAGGFGLIYRGYHEGLGETVAIKCLRIASIQKTNEKIREALAGRFRDETKLLYRLSQGNLDIVRCISSGTLMAPRTNEYTPYMILEWLDGCTLSAELKERRERRLGARSLRAAVELLDSAAGGIAYAHTHDVVHRDVKPGNLFLTRTREGVRMKVLDFGLAKILSDEAIGVSPSVQTGVGVHFCSPSYGAPEQFTSQVGKIGPWTDVYSLCLVLLEVMLGDKVRPAANLAQGLLSALDPVKGSPSASSLGLKVPRGVEELLLRALAQDPTARPHDAGVFWLELKEAMVGLPVSAPSELLATVADDNVDSAMQRAREQVLQRIAAAQPSPFAGTMLMDNAPRQSAAPGSAQAYASAQGLVQTSMAAPLPAAGQPVNGTAPLAPPIHRERAPDRMKSTMPLSAMSPLASSISLQSPPPGLLPPPPGASGPPGPSAPITYGGQQSVPTLPPAAALTHGASMVPPQHAASQAPPHRERAGMWTDPRPRTTMAPSRDSMRNVLIVTVIAVVGVLGLFAIYWYGVRGH